MNFPKFVELQRVPLLGRKPIAAKGKGRRVPTFLDGGPYAKGGPNRLSNTLAQEVSPKRSRFRVAQEGPTSSSNELRRRHSKFGQRPNLAQGGPEKSVQHLRHPPSLILLGRVAPGPLPVMMNDADRARF